MSIEIVGVVGCGQMGLGIIETIASAGLHVRAARATGGDLAPVRAKLKASLDRRVAKGKLTAEEREAILGRIELTNDLDRVAEGELVIETALEEPNAKIDLLGRLEAAMSPGAILATNTSSLPVAALAKSLARPAQFLGLHFFNPVPVMKLVEVAPTPVTAPGVVFAMKSFCQDIGKAPVEIAALPGYAVNRLLVPYILHSIETLESGIASADAIDDAMKLGCGHPMGPLALADLIGLDVVFAMAKTLQRELNDQRYRAPSLLRRLVLAGHLGQKSKLGIYDYRDGEKKPNAGIGLGPRTMVVAASDAE